MDYLDIKKLRERQNQLVSEARGYTDQIKDDTPAEEVRELEVKFDQHMVEVDEIEERIARAQRLEAAEDRMNNRPADESRRPGASDNRSARSADEQNGDDNATQWDETLAFRTFAAFGQGAVPVEHRALLHPSQLENRALDHLPAEIRGLVVGTPASGGYLVPEGFSNELERFMVAYGPMLDPGVTRELNTASGNQIPWPTVDDTANTSEAHAEGGAVTDDGNADPAFGQRMLNAYVYDSEIVRVSIELLQDSFNDLESLLGELLGERLGRGGNARLTTGTGTDEPNGIANATTGVTAAGAAAITFDEIIDLIHSVDPAYRSAPSCAMMFRDSTLQALRKIKDGDGNYLWSAPNAQSREPANIWGYPYVVNQAMPAATTGNNSIVFGDMRKYVVRKVGGISVFRFDEKYMNELEIGFMAFHRIDGEIINTAALRTLTQA